MIQEELNVEYSAKCYHWIYKFQIKKINAEVRVLAVVGTNLLHSVCLF